MIISNVILENLLAKYDKISLECDGLTRVISYILNENKINHKTMCGFVNFCMPNESPQVISPHYWITIDERIIDYRLRMWLGNYNYVPHGIFIKNKNIDYFGQPINLVMNKTIFDILVTPWIKPSQIRAL